MVTNAPAQAAPTPAAPTFPLGFCGQILRVDLSRGTIRTEALDENLARMYLGGAGFIAYYLWKELKAGVDALGPENKLIFALGPVTGLILPGASRHSIGAKSPLTGGIAKAEVGGFWMVELKRAGYDAIIVEGKSDKPVYLWVHDGQAEIRDARHLWGKETRETEAALRQELGDERLHVAMIGPAGENLVRFSCIMEGLRDSAGRGGLGAVMGSKNLKAIAARGTKAPRVADEEKVKDIRQRQAARPSFFSQYGTGGPDMIAGEQSGNLPVRNWRDGLFPETKNITGVTLKETIRIAMDGCYACHIRCKKVVKADEPYEIDPLYGGPEYETLAALGSCCGVGDVKAICRGNQLCGAYALDTISAGNVIAFAMECYENGLLTKQDTGGLELNFGNSEAMLQAIELIARREGIGNLMAEGVREMSRKIGRGSEVYAMHTKGLEPGMHEPRIKPALALGYMVFPTGADHCNGIQDPFVSSEMMFKPYHPLGWLKPVPINDIGPRKVGLFRLGHLKAMVDDSMALCTFTGYSLELEAELLKAVTGWDTGLPELLRIGERIVTLMRLFNVREGFSAKDDTLPERYFQPKKDGILSDTHMDRAAYEKARNYYYVLMGWDGDGIPLPEKIEELYIE